MKYHSEAHRSGPLVNMARAALVELEQDDGHNASVTLYALVLVVNKIAEGQALNHGGVPETYDSTSKPHHTNTHHNDGGTAHTAIDLINLAKISDEALSNPKHAKLAKVLPGETLRGMAWAIFNNMLITVAARGGLPGQTEAQDPTQPAKQRDHEPEDAIDTDATRLGLKAANHYYAVTSQDHPVREELKGSLRRILAATEPGKEPARYIRFATQPIYGTEDGQETDDPNKAAKNYAWSVKREAIERELGGGD